MVTFFIALSLLSSGAHEYRKFDSAQEACASAAAAGSKSVTKVWYIEDSAGKCCDREYTPFYGVADACKKKPADYDCARPENGVEQMECVAAPSYTVRPAK